jgi:Leucine-rich repeat (LRR) protein
LTRLDLYGNRLSTFPPEIGELTNLTSLKLYGNKLSALPESIKNLSNLGNLSLRENNFSAEEKEKIEKWLPNCKIDWEKT